MYVKHYMSTLFCVEAMSSTIARVFHRGTFLESSVTYGGADSGAICKEPLQRGTLPHHRPKTLFLEREKV